jgi:hypothetical protein
LKREEDQQQEEFNQAQERRKQEEFELRQVAEKVCYLCFLILQNIKGPPWKLSPALASINSEHQRPKGPC